MGVARLRRDGFAAMKAESSEGTLTTEVLKYQGEFLFVNANCTEGRLTAEILDQEGNVIPGYSRQDCCVMTEDKTKFQIRWRDKQSLSGVSPDKMRIRFILHNASIYAFWITDSEEGKSHGYLGAGSPELKTGNKDD